MVRIATITHDPDFAVVRTSQAEHPFSRAREFQRAFNASKLNKIFAKPFLGTLTGHSDGVSVLAKCPLACNKVISGSHNGELKIWDLVQRKCLLSVYDHNQSVRGVSFSREGSMFLSSSLDKTINLYNFQSMLTGEDQHEVFYGSHRRTQKQKGAEPITKYLSKTIVGNVEHAPDSNTFATSGQIVQLWSYERTKSIYQLEWNVDSILSVKYDPSQANILCGTCADRSIIIYDLRSESPVQKASLQNKAMCLSFNPIEPINFTIGNDDGNCYTFDLRKMEKAKTIHKDHIGAVTDLDYSPTGREFVSGSFDRTIRIFDHNAGRSREVYHSKRMQIVSSAQYTMDSHYVLSGSEDMNIRIWKNVAWRPVGNLSNREERAIQYREKLVDKYKHSNRIRRIVSHRHLPKYILNANKRKQDQVVSQHNKILNKEANTGVKENRRRQKDEVVEAIGIEKEILPKRVKKQRKEVEEAEEDEVDDE